MIHKTLEFETVPMVAAPIAYTQQANEDPTKIFSKSGRVFQKKSGLNFLFWTKNLLLKTVIKIF